MKKKLFLLILFIIASLGLSTAQNLVTNGGFENGESNWQLLGGTNINYSIDNTNAIEGSNCLMGEVTQLGANPWSIQIKNAFGPVEEGVLYQASIWIRSATIGSTVNFTIGKNTANYDEYASAYGMSVTNEWTRYTLELAAQVSTPDDIALAMHITSEDTYWFDDFRVIKVVDEIKEATVNSFGSSILLEFQTNLTPTGENDQLPFFVYSPERNYQVSEVISSNEPKELTLRMEYPIIQDEIITVDYIPGTLRSSAGVEISEFSIEAINGSQIPASLISTGENNIRIYPLPFSDRLTIQLPENYAIHSINILDMSGKELYQRVGLYKEDQLNLQLSFLESGMYILMLESDNGSRNVLKIIKN